MLKGMSLNEMREAEGCETNKECVSSLECISSSEHM